MRSAIIVDAYSSGNLLSEAFKKKNLRTLHVQSSSLIPAGYLKSFKADTFEKTFIYSESLGIEKLLNDLQGEDVSCVLAGSEPGVMLADLLSESMNLNSNGTEFSLCRRNKYEMIERVRAQGIRCPQQSIQTSLESGLDWIKQNCSYPVILKPTESAGTDHVFTCHSIEQVSAAFDSILGKTNQVLKKNTAVLFQEFLHGVEFAVNTVSLQGSHVTSSIWKYIKRPIKGSDVNFYDRDELISPDTQDFRELDSYSKKILDALRVSIGPAHIEIMMTQSGPVLIELGARMSGVTMPNLDAATLGYGQVELTVDAYTDAQAFFDRVSNRRPLINHTQLVTTFSYREGEAIDTAGLDKIRKFKSYFSERIKFGVNDLIPITRDVFTSPGFIVLMHEDLNQINRDYESVRELEESGLFTFRDRGTRQ